MFDRADVENVHVWLLQGTVNAYAGDVSHNKLCQLC